MNRLEELKKQATEDILGVKILNADIFAELLINECIAVADKYAGGGAGSEWELGSLYSAEAISDEIKEKFGMTNV